MRESRTSGSVEGCGEQSPHLLDTKLRFLFHTRYREEFFSDKGSSTGYNLLYTQKGELCYDRKEVTEGKEG